MKKKKHSPQKSKPKNVVSPVQSLNEIPARRHFLNRVLNAAIALPIIAGVGYYSVSLVKASMSEADLSKIGNGRPVIVQIHDPNCALCRTLQNQTRDVLEAFESDKFEYLVANIKTQKGSRFAAGYGVPHVTLLLFDAEGKMTQTVRGPIRTSVLSGIIKDHMRRYS